MTTILSLIKELKLDLTQGVIYTYNGTGIDHEFNITPKDFLSYSKQDFKTQDKRGNINALSNAKRAIDCQTDKIFHSIGLDPNNFPKAIEEFVLKSNVAPEKKDLPIRLRFLQALGFAPANIIANTRLLRNKLEHFYKKPTNEEVSNAIELAELFILATDNKLKTIWTFSIYDKRNYIAGHLDNSLRIDFVTGKNIFELTAFFGKGKQKKLRIKNTELEFYHLLKIATSFDYKEDAKTSAVDLIECINHPIPKNNISFEIEF